jgi:chromosome partitioning protein
VRDLSARRHARPLRVLPADLRAERDAQTLYLRPKRHELLAKALARLEPAPKVVVVDCPPSLGALTENGIAAANVVLAPCQMEARSADAIADLLALVDVVKDADRFTPGASSTPDTTPRKAITNRAIEGALEGYTDHTLTTRIPVNEALNQAQIEQVDIFTYAPASKGAAAYMELARELLAVAWLRGRDADEVFS